MKTIKDTILLFLALVACTINQAQAEVKPVLGISLTLYTQGELVEDEVSGITRGTIEKSKATTKGLLEFMAEATAQENEPGNYIEVDLQEGAVALKNRDGETVADLSEHIEVSLDDEGGLFSGTYDANTDKEKSKSLATIRLRIQVDDEVNGDTDLDMSGVAAVSFSHTGRNEDEEYNASGSISATVSGNGQLEGENVLIVGKITLKGKEKVRNDEP